jgi:hypothetical protein
MNQANYKSALQAARDEMEELLRQRTRTDARLGQLKQTIETLSALVGEQPAETANLPGELFGESGITGAIRLLFQRSKIPLTPVQIRTELTNHGFDLSDYVNAMAVIHNTLKRLNSQGELIIVTDVSGQAVAYTARKSIGQMIADGATSDDSSFPHTPAEAKQRLREVMKRSTVGNDGVLRRAGRRP